jgi:predicted Fe-Mo cluster-binding NifX family protein
MICGGIGGGAINAMAESGIKVYAGASGNADEVIKSYLAGTLAEVGEATCDHHDHEHQGAHDCGHGGCQH